MTFEAWYKAEYGNSPGTDEYVAAWKAWQAATLLEREACAKEVDFMLSEHCANKSEGRAYELAAGKIRARSKP